MLDVPIGRCTDLAYVGSESLASVVPIASASAEGQLSDLLDPDKLVSWVPRTDVNRAPRDRGCQPPADPDTAWRQGTLHRDEGTLFRSIRHFGAADGLLGDDETSTTT